ncbi:hypothetical protein SRABI80_04491 [Peribacillus frigoritolerans]|nr:hypothetical protein SRABI80_04491 [Peribacillus frigoritolerans]
MEKQIGMFPSISDKFHFLPIPYIKQTSVQNKELKEFDLGYFGDFYSRDRNIQPLYSVAEKYNFSLKICGNSDVPIKCNSKIKVSPRINYDLVKKYEGESEILVCICNTNGTQLPGKIYHYAASTKPILVILDGERSMHIKEYLEKFDRYIICFNTEESIKEAINSIKNSNKEYDPSPFFAPIRIAKGILEYAYPNIKDKVR